jgi:F-type H+-transporting ATPase subunit beta
MQGTQPLNSAADAQVSGRLYGRVTAVRGTVIDAWFENGLPPIDAALECALDGTPVTAVVHSHLGKSSVRAIAVGGTRGMRRGAKVISNGAALRIPVGNQLIGRVIDLLGRPLDGGSPLSWEPSLPVYRSPPPTSFCRGLGDVYATASKSSTSSAVYTRWKSSGIRRCGSWQDRRADRVHS